MNIVNTDVQAHSSAQRKELFKKIQLCEEDGHIPKLVVKLLLMDMKVRWSSTYVMLERAEELKEVYISSFNSAPFNSYDGRMSTTLSGGLA